MVLSAREQGCPAGHTQLQPLLAAAAVPVKDITCPSAHPAAGHLGACSRSVAYRSWGRASSPGNRIHHVGLYLSIHAARIMNTNNLPEFDR